MKPTGRMNMDGIPDYCKLKWAIHKGTAELQRANAELLVSSLDTGYCFGTNYVLLLLISV
jgi:hypothetical protein